MKKITFLLIFISMYGYAQTTIKEANRTGFTFFSPQGNNDLSFGYGFTAYSAAWALFENYPGPRDFQVGLGSQWMTPQLTGNEPENFYTTIEGGLGWWQDTRFATKTPKFIMGGASYNFYASANGPGAGSGVNLQNGQRDWSVPGGKYSVAQLSNKLLWAPDGLNMAQSLNGEMLGYGYTPLPLTETMMQTNGVDVQTGNQSWTLFLNATNFKGPAAFFLPTFWTDPVLENPSLEGLFLDSRPSNPDVAMGMEYALSPALISEDAAGDSYAKIQRVRFPVTNEDNSMLLQQATIFSENALWNAMENWFNGGAIVPAGINPAGTNIIPFQEDPNFLLGKIEERGTDKPKHEIDLRYMDYVRQYSNSIGYEFDLDVVLKKDGYFILPEYFKLDTDNKWQAITEDAVPGSANLVQAEVPSTPRTQIPYLTPLDPACQWQDPDGPWSSPGPTAGPFTTDLGDGSTLTYYWYRFIDQPAIIHANYPEDFRNEMQNRIELIHSNWSHTDEYIQPPAFGELATIDPKTIVQPPAGLEIGYVPIVTKQEQSTPKVRVFVLAGQSNMQGYGLVEDNENDPGSLINVIQNDTDGEWSEIGGVNNWDTLEGVLLYAGDGDIKTNVTVGQGVGSNYIGPELMFAHQLDAYYDDPVLIIKTATGGTNLAVNWRPPSAGGETGELYSSMIQTIQNVTQNLGTEFPDIGTTDFEISGFAWFQGWSDAGDESRRNEYESNLTHLIHDVRSDLNIPDLPVIIANSGHGGYRPSDDQMVQYLQNNISVSQKNVGTNDSMYGGKVGFVETKKHWQELSESPNEAIHHFHENARLYLNIGKDIGNEMIKAINDASFFNEEECDGEIIPDLVSLGNRVWNDYNRNGINDPNEPGIPGVSVFLHSDSDGDGIPDGLQGAAGFEITDSEGYYKFTNLEPGPYNPFIWSVNNWGAGEPLEGFIYTNNFVSNADNDVDLDNNGSGDPGTDGEPIIIILNAGEEPLDEFDENDCYYNYDPSGNNSVDFGFYDPSIILAITSSGSGIDLQENSGAAQSVYTITAAGAFGVASYSISGDDASLLSVNTETGVVSLDANPDYETKNSYRFTATASDDQGNTSAAIIVTFNITDIDTTIPVITITGDATVTVQVGDTYTDAGATALDNYDGDLTASIVTVNPVDTDTVGAYTVTYNVTDANGNTAVTVTRTINVVDTTIPVITLTGDATVTIEVGSTYTDAGATASDNYDGDITANILAVSTVDTAVIGSYTVTYDITDANGNTAVTVTRTINVVDTTIPVITLTGDATVTVEVGDTYTDAGATASDNYDGDLTASIVTVNPVDTDIVGAYTVTYNVTDANGNVAVEVTRTVNVEYILSVEDDLKSILKIYPNPTRTSWKISASIIIESIELYDIIGRKVLSVNPKTKDYEVNGTLLSDGVYILLLNGKKVSRLIKN